MARKRKKNQKRKNKTKQITLRNKRYLLKQVPYMGDAIGHCSDPSDVNKTIRLKSGLKGEEELEVLIHEMLHACFWDIAEESIDEAGVDIARVLWRLGYRKTDSIK
jgi:hypothetical protein